MSRFVLVLCYFNLCIVFTIQAARILVVIPTPMISHQVVFRPLTQELAKRGHEVLVITTDPAFPKGQAPANLTEIDVHDISYDIWRESIQSSYSDKKNDRVTHMNIILNAFMKISRRQMLTDEVQNLLRHESKHFDLLLLEACMKSALYFSHVFKAPVILISSLGSIPGNYEMIGAPTYPPHLYPRFWTHRLYNLTFWEKVIELYYLYYMEKLFLEDEEKTNAMLRNVFGPNIPAIHELGNNVHMIFYNTHPIWEGNRPVPPSVVYIGGIDNKPLKELPKDLESFLDSSVNGVIYVSFGSHVSPSLLPNDKLQAMLKVFSQLSYDVLLKWDKDELPEKSKNIKISKWLPQTDLLKHPKIKLFITQGGLQSTDDAIAAGVPLIGIPMVTDQWYNVEKYAYHKIGLRYDLETLTEESFIKAIHTVIGDESYRRNVARLRTLMFDQPQRPLERAVWWTEHVLRYGGARHLRAPAANMSWSEYLDLEFLLILLISSLLILVIVLFAIYSLLRFLKSTITNVKSKIA